MREHEGERQVVDSRRGHHARRRLRFAPAEVLVRRRHLDRPCRRMRERGAQRAEQTHKRD
jgi:hypothetical protein